MKPHRTDFGKLTRHLFGVALSFRLILLVNAAKAAELIPEDIGAGTPGTLSAVPNGWRLSAAGRGLGGTSDQFFFAYQPQAGDFDCAVRVVGVDRADVWSRAGLMIRQSLEPGSPFAAVLASPNLSGCFFQSRPYVGGSASPLGHFPVNFPDTWLRLKSKDGQVTAYAGVNGENWEVLGSAQLGWTNAGYFGLAVTSQNTNAVCTAEFCDLQTAQDLGAPQWPRDFESLGPSSRRTTLAITEIMYKPAPTPQGHNTCFVEIFNAHPFFEDISGYRLAGTIDYTFPEGTLIQGGELLVVAAAPADLQSAYAMQGVLGPYTGTLGVDGTLQLLDRSGGVLLEVPYDNRPPWPTGTDGSGHSLVLSRPSCGERSPLAWSASGRKGGSPGRVDGRPSGRLHRLRINEVRVGAVSPTENFVEIFNHSTVPVDASGARLGLLSNSNRWIVPQGTTIEPGAYAHFADPALGLAQAQLVTAVILESPDGNSIVDTLWLADEARIAPIGRFPNGSDYVTRLESASPGAPNSSPASPSVVINEIFYHPISDDSREEFVELHNPGSAAVDVSGWAFTDGITYTIPQGRSIPARGYLVIARDAAHLLALNPGLSSATVVGDFDGKLSNSGERLTLARPVQAGNGITPMVTVETVEYGTGGRWGRWADGGGSSLERCDPHSPADAPVSWTDSDESRSAGWTTIETTGVLDNGGSTPNYLHVMMLGAGECLIDDVQVFAQGVTANLVANSTFEGGLQGWVVLGNHVRSSLESGEGYESGKCLRVRASGRGDTGANQVRVILGNSTVLRPGTTATIRAKVRWLKGFPEVLLRLRGNYLEATGRLSLPESCGTPGGPNNSFAGNVGPAIAGVAHYPALPAGDSQVRVMARVQDPDGISSVSLNYRVDPATQTAAVVMHDDGTAGDAVAGDGVYSALLPPQQYGALVAFHVTASDAAGVPVQSMFPANAPARECLVRFGELMPASSFGTYRLWLTAATVTTWRNRPILSNEELDGTFVYGNQRVVYNAGGRYSGSPWHQGSYSSPISTGTLALSMPGDNPVLGTTSFNKVHVPGNTPGDDATLQCEETAYWMAKQMGFHANHQRYVIMYVNGIRRGQLMEDTQVPAGEVLDERFPGDSDGPLYKLNGWYEYEPGTGPTLSHTLLSWCTLNNYTTTGGAKKLASYRWNWSPRSEAETANDYTELFRLIDAANSYNTPQYVQNLRGHADIDQWLRIFALQHAVGNWDSFGNRNAQNMYAYKPSQDRWKLLIWDFNIVLGNSGSDGPSGDNLFQYNGGDRAMGRIYQEPEFARVYLRTLQEIAAGPMTGPDVERVIDARYSAFKAAGVNATLPSALKTWISSRRRYLQSFTGRYEVPFALDAAFSAQTTTNRNWLEVTGTAPLTVSAVSVNGIAYPVRWTSLTNWSAIVPLRSGLNNLAVQALDSSGQILPGMTGSATVLYNGSDPALAESVVINEILYRPVSPGAEFVELWNRSTNSLVDLTGLRLQGLDYDFPSGTTLLPGEFLLLVRNRAVFSSLYGYNKPVLGEFPGQLSPTGETLRLIRPSDPNPATATVDEVTFGNDPPWPQEPNTPGVALQLADASVDNRLAENWGAITPAQADAPDWKFVSVTGTPGESRLLLFHSPYEAPVDPMELAGAWEGAIDFSGQLYHMRVEFQRDASNRWSGMFIGEDLVNPLGNIRFTPPTVSFGLANIPVAISWNGRINTNGGITGTFSQSTPQGSVSAPFYLDRARESSGVAGGEVFIDDVQLVTGTVPGAGANLVRNGGFELPLEGTWTIASNHAATVVSAAVKHSGNASLRLSATLGGKDVLSAVWQDTLPLIPGGTYTLSYWYLPSTNGNDLTVRTSDGGLVSSHPIHPDQIATPGFANSRIQTIVTNPPALPRVFINEWLAANTGTTADPADGDFDDWFELYNAEDDPIDLSGFTLTDTATKKDKWRIPDGTTIPARGFLLVWADEESGQNSPGVLHANFKLSQGGEAIGLFAPNGAQIDWVTFQQQSTDISEGRAGDGVDGQWTRFTSATPGLSNEPAHPKPLMITGATVSTTGAVTLSWPAVTGHQYQIQVTDSLAARLWSNLGGPVIASGSSAAFTDAAAGGQSTRFYRIKDEGAR